MEKQEMISEQMEEAMDMDDDEDTLDEDTEKLIQGIELGMGGGGGK